MSNLQFPHLLLREYRWILCLIFCVRCWISEKSRGIFYVGKSQINIITYHCKSGNLFQNFYSVHVSNESGCFIPHQSSADILWLSCIRKKQLPWLLKAHFSTELLLSSIYYKNVLKQILATVFHQGNYDKSVSAVTVEICGIKIPKLFTDSPGQNFQQKRNCSVLKWW